PPTYAEKQLVVIQSARLGIEAKKALAEYLKEPFLSTVLVIAADDRKPDYRDVLTAQAAASDGVVVFKPLREEEAVARLREAAGRAQTALEENAARLLVQEAGTDWGILQAELEKLILYSKGRGRINRDDVLACLGYRKASNPF